MKFWDEKTKRLLTEEEMKSSKEKKPSETKKGCSSKKVVADQPDK